MLGYNIYVWVCIRVHIKISFLCLMFQSHTKYFTYHFYFSCCICTNRSKMHQKFSTMAILFYKVRIKIQNSFNFYIRWVYYTEHVLVKYNFHDFRVLGYTFLRFRYVINARYKNLNQIIDLRNTVKFKKFWDFIKLIIYRSEGIFYTLIMSTSVIKI